MWRRLIGLGVLVGGMMVAAFVVADRSDAENRAPVLAVVTGAAAVAAALAGGTLQSWATRDQIVAASRDRLRGDVMKVREPSAERLRVSVENGAALLRAAYLQARANAGVGTEASIAADREMAARITAEQRDESMLVLVQWPATVGLQTAELRTVAREWYRQTLELGRLARQEDLTGDAEAWRRFGGRWQVRRLDWDATGERLAEELGRYASAQDID